MCASKMDSYIHQNVVTDVKYSLTFSIFYWLEAQVLPTPKGRGLYKGVTPWRSPSVCPPQLSVNASCSPLFKSKLSQRDTDEPPSQMHHTPHIWPLISATRGPAVQRNRLSSCPFLMYSNTSAVLWRVLESTLGWMNLSSASSGETFLSDKSEVHLCDSDLVMLLSSSPQIVQSLGWRVGSRQGPVCLLIPHISPPHTHRPRWGGSGNVSQLERGPQKNRHFWRQELCVTCLIPFFG